VVAFGQVAIARPGLAATGERLVYTAGDQVFLLTGTKDAPPKAVDAQGTTSGAALRLRNTCDAGGGVSVEALGKFRGTGAAGAHGIPDTRREEQSKWEEMNSQGMMRTLATGVQSRMDEATQERVETAVTATVRTLATEEISKAYAGRQVVRGVSMEIAQGEVVGLLGPNGAGKTTIFYMIVGLVRPEAGRILADGEDITRLPMYLRARQHGISYLPQEPSIFRKLSVEENILAVLEAQPLSWESRRTRTEKLIEQLNLGHVRKTMGYALSGASAAEWRLRAAWRLSRRLFCWMSRSPGSIRLRCWSCRRSFSI